MFVVSLAVYADLTIKDWEVRTEIPEYDREECTLTVDESGPSFGNRLEDRRTRFRQLEVEVPAPSDGSDEAL